MFATVKSLATPLLVCLIALGGGLPSPAVAATETPSAFILALGSRTLDLLKKTELSQEQREREFRDIFLIGFDVDLISRFALGRHWRAATAAQRTEYRDVFERFIVRSYSARLGSFAGETINHTDTLVRTKRDSLVRTVILRHGHLPVRIDWRVRNTDGHYKIVDVVVEGVSMLISHRSEFASVIQNNGGSIQHLIDALRNSDILSAEN